MIERALYFGHREGSNLEEVVEKQADLIEYLKQHNTLLSKRLLNLTAQHWLLRSGATAVLFNILVSTQEKKETLLSCFFNQPDPVEALADGLESKALPFLHSLEASPSAEMGW